MPSIFFAVDPREKGRKCYKEKDIKDLSFSVGGILDSYEQERKLDLVQAIIHFLHPIDKIFFQWV
jgi:hypothetical protein